MYHTRSAFRTVYSRLAATAVLCLTIGVNFQLRYKARTDGTSHIIIYYVGTVYIYNCVIAMRILYTAGDGAAYEYLYFASRAAACNVVFIFELYFDVRSSYYCLERFLCDIYEINVNRAHSIPTQILGAFSIGKNVDYRCTYTNLAAHSIVPERKIIISKYVYSATTRRATGVLYLFYCSDVRSCLILIKWFQSKEYYSTHRHYWRWRR